MKKASVLFAVLFSISLAYALDDCSNESAGTPCGQLPLCGDPDTLVSFQFRCDGFDSCQPAEPIGVEEICNGYYCNGLTLVHRIGSCELLVGGDGYCSVGSEEDWSCNDQDPCTIDSCSPEEDGCSNVPIECSEGFFCDLGQCVPEGSEQEVIPEFNLTAILVILVAALAGFVFIKRK